MTQKVKLKRGYDIDVIVDDCKISNEIVVLGNYSKSNFSQTPIISVGGVAPTFTENHGQIFAIEVIEDGSKSINRIR